MTVEPSPPHPGEPSSGVQRGRSDASSPWRAGLALLRIAVACMFVVVAAIGALVTPPVVMLVVAPLLGCGVGLLVALLDRAFPGEPWASRGALSTGATAAAFVPFTSGLTLLGSAGGVVAIALLVFGSCLAADRAMDLMEEIPPGDALRDDDWLRDVMPSLPTAALLHEWRAMGAVVAGCQGLRAQVRAVHVRGLLLEELARRDPSAVDRWLRSGWSSEGR